MSTKPISEYDNQQLAGFGNAYNSAKKQWQAAVAAGNQADAAIYAQQMEAAHAGAEQIRASYGFSGGEDGSQRIALPNQPQQSSYDLSAMLKKAKQAQLTAQLAELKGAYEQTQAEYDAQAKQLPEAYDQVRNQAAAQNALARKSFDERALAAGLNTGASGQMELARSSALQRELAQADREQEGALQQLELEKTKLKSQYQTAIMQAQAQGNAELANALYQEMVRVQNLEREDAQLQAGQEKAQTQQDSLQQAGQSRGYNNGSRTAGEIRRMQEFYGLGTDGMWGPDSQKTTGMTADEAWNDYTRYLSYAAQVDNLKDRRDSSAAVKVIEQAQLAGLSEQALGKLLDKIGY